MPYRCNVGIFVTRETATNVQQVQIEADTFGEIEKFACSGDCFRINRYIRATGANVKTDTNQL